LEEAHRRRKKHSWDMENKGIRKRKKKKKKLTSGSHVSMGKE
jgi:hypothetical protein